MTNPSILDVLKRAAPRLHWRIKEGRFMATHGTAGFVTSIEADTPRHKIVTKALAIQKELISVMDGTADEETQKLYRRDSSQHLDSSKAPETVGKSGK